MDSVSLSINIGKPEKLFRFSGGDIDGWLDHVGDFARSGEREILGFDATLAYFGDMAYAYSPDLYLVMGRKGTKWTDITKQCPGPVLQVAARDRAVPHAARRC
ncbi:MAG: hypothetical protein KGR26_06670, partial [Cyanobacteria bacterium REEB65]|nr:hypothetical protein [Cyanobacteria bacterium REEB65]